LGREFLRAQEPAGIELLSLKMLIIIRLGNHLASFLPGE